MLGNCPRCSDRFLLTYYPQYTTLVNVECPRCHHKYDLLVKGDDDKDREIPFEVKEKLAKKFFREPEPEPPLSEYEKDTTSNSKSIRYDLKKFGGYSRYPNDSARLKTWDQILDKNFAACSFNTSHLKRYKSQQIKNDYYVS